MVVIVILGILSAIAFVQYSRTIEFSIIKRGKHALTLIHSASEIYKSRHGTYPDFHCGNLSGYAYTQANKDCLEQINNTLKVNIPYDRDISFNYNYQNAAYPDTFIAEAIRKVPCWVLRVASTSPIGDNNPTWHPWYPYPH